MLHILFRLATARPQLLADHVAAYTDLATEELGATAVLLKRRLTLQFIGLGCFAVTAVLAGVAVMLWAALPAGALREPWVLALVPALPAACGLWAVAMAKGVASGHFVATMRAQFAIDAALLRRADHQ